MNKLLKNILFGIWGLFVVAGALSSCTDKELEGKNNNPADGQQGEAEGELVELRFTANQPGSDDDPETRSTLVSGGHQLVWSNYDNLGVYAYETGATSATASAIATIDANSVGSTSATFTGSMALTANKYYRYYAYYPEMDGAVNTITDTKVEFTIPTEQYYWTKDAEITENENTKSHGEFGKYQVCYAKSTQHQILDADNPPTIKFDSFTPATALIRVYPKLDASLARDAVTTSELVLASRNKKLSGNATFDMVTGGWTSGDRAQVRSHWVESYDTKWNSKSVKITKERQDDVYFDFVVIPGATGDLIVCIPATSVNLAGNIEITTSEIRPGTLYESNVTLSGPRLKIDASNAPKGYASIANSNPIYKNFKSNDAKGKDVVFMHRNCKAMPEGAPTSIYLGNKDNGYLTTDCFKNLRMIIVHDPGCQMDATTGVENNTNDFDLYFTGSSAAADYCTYGNRAADPPTDVRLYFPPDGCTGFRIERRSETPNVKELCKSISLWYDDSTSEVLSLVFHDGTVPTYNATTDDYEYPIDPATGKEESHIRNDMFTYKIPTHGSGSTGLGSSPKPPTGVEVIEGTSGVTYEYILKGTTNYKFSLHVQYHEGLKYGDKDAYYLYLNSEYGLLMGKRSGAYIQFPAIANKKLIYVDWSSVNHPGYNETTASSNIGTVVNKSSSISVSGGELRNFKRGWTHKYHLLGTIDNVRYRLQVQGEHNLAVKSLTLIYE